MRNFVYGIIFIILGLVVPTDAIVQSIKFDKECEGYLKNAADANTPEIALDRINHALEYMEANGLTNGYTSVLWTTEDENIGFWYQNIKACKGELEACLGSPQFEKTNVLMKVRETLTDEGENGTIITVPCGISRYPNNTKWFLAGCVSIFFILMGISNFVYALRDYMEF